MGEIAEMLQQKANLSPEQAQQVEQLITEHIMSRVPSEFQGVVGSVLGVSGGEAAPAESGGLGSLLGAASSLFGGNKG
jgi:hypothetical protein